MKDQQRIALAILLSICVMIFWMEFVVKPKEQEVKKAKVEEFLKEQTVKNNTTTDSSPVTINNNLSQPEREQYLTAKQLEISSEKINLKLSLLGARITSLILNEYKAHFKSEDAIEMLKFTGNTFPLGAWYDGNNDADLNYEITSVEGTGIISDSNNKITIPPSAELKLKLSSKLKDGRSVFKELKIKGNSYLIDVKLGINSNEIVPISLEWVEHIASKDDFDKYNLRQIVFLDNQNKIQRTAEANLKETTANAKWISFGDKYFFNSIISAEGSSPISFNKDTDKIVFSSNKLNKSADFKIYSGPKDREILLASAYDLNRSIDLGTFAIIGEPILWLLRACYKLIGNYGLAIILVTLLIKLLVLPLTKSAFKAMKSMQEIQPQILALREREKDPTKLNMEMLALYKKNGINPMGGCLPTLLQLPVFLGMYNALQSSIELRHAPFALWIQDLSSPEKLYVMGFGIPVMILLMGASMYLQQLTVPQPADPAQRKIMLFMPIVFTGMFLLYPFPSGLVLYWLVNNIISIIQQTALRSAKGISSLKSTIIGSICIFGVGFILTLL